ncbi:MAG: serine/threonine protein kinase [Pyrinomonadaceae bacterium]
MIGKTLDEKYRIESELGRGGMGTVYLATHLGTERPVAIKVISPQYMQRPEFVERFRREARAAGRLRHPNVVDVTDFGFAKTDGGQVAYLVMEYLDGCTLGEILEEERNLPVSWTLDILEQVCSAVHEAHSQGIIHRDLKPDNIWLEPNQRGGYTVKVLDFGIAKLETGPNTNPGSFMGTPLVGGAQTSAGVEGTIHDSISPTLAGESGTIAGLSEACTAIIKVWPESETNGSENATAIMDTVVATDQDSAGTKLLSEKGDHRSDGRSLSDSYESMPTKDLTRVGAVLGTPLYMSPEQCRGLRLDARSDIYSLGVIGYQMLSGSTPFSGDFTQIMESHKLVPPPPFKAKKVRKKLRRAIFSALEKEPDKRPQSAEAFATILRSRSEGIFGLLRRAGMIYTEHIGKFLALSIFFYIPMIVLTVGIIAISILRVTDQVSERTATISSVVFGTSLGIATAFCAYLIIGTTTWIVTQSLAVPLRPIRLRSALRETRRKWKRFAGTGILTTVLQIGFGIITCGLGFLATSVLWTLVGPVVMMENLKGWPAIKRSTELVRRSLVTSIAAVFIMFIVPAIVAGLISAAVNLSVLAITNEAQKAEITKNGDETSITVNTGEGEREVGFSVGTNRGVRIMNMDPDTQKRARNAISESLLQILLLPLQIVMTSFTAIIVALLYLKTRQAGGESLNELLANFEESDQPRKKWQERVRQRLIESGRVTSKSTG